MSKSRAAITYSEAFKLKVVQELESGNLAYEELRRRYGIRGSSTVQKWVIKYGNGTRGKIVRVETPEEMSELNKLRERVKLLEAAVADATIDLALERAYTRIACQRAGIQDIEQFKKKADGKLRTKR